MSSPIIPTLRYREAARAMDWLCTAFGFEKRLVVPGENGTIEHAQLTFGTGMIMLGTSRDDSPFDAIQVPPDPEQMTVTQSPYIVVENVDTHYVRALSAKAVIVMEPANQDYGGRLYSCKDLEGHLWNFGSYDPWAAT